MNEYDEKLIELKRYLEWFVDRHCGSPLTLNQVSTHLKRIESFEEELQILSEYSHNKEVKV